MTGDRAKNIGKIEGGWDEQPGPGNQSTPRGIWRGGGMIGSIIVAFIGGVILVAMTRLLKRLEI